MEATAADIFTKNELLTTMQLAVVFMAVELRCPLEIRVWLTQMVEATGVETFLAAPVMVVMTTAAQQS